MFWVVCSQSTNQFCLYFLHLHHLSRKCETHLVKDVVQGVLVIENTPSKDKTLVCSRDDSWFCVQSSDNQFLELVYRCLSADHDRKAVRGMAR